MSSEGSPTSPSPPQRRGSISDFMPAEVKVTRWNKFMCWWWCPWRVDSTRPSSMVSSLLVVMLGLSLLGLVIHIADPVPTQVVGNWQSPPAPPLPNAPPPATPPMHPPSAAAFWSALNIERAETEIELLLVVVFCCIVPGIFAYWVRWRVGKRKRRIRQWTEMNVRRSSIAFAPGELQLQLPDFARSERV